MKQMSLLPTGLAFCHGCVVGGVDCKLCEEEVQLLNVNVIVKIFCIKPYKINDKQSPFKFDYADLQLLLSSDVCLHVLQFAFKLLYENYTTELRKSTKTNAPLKMI